MRRCKLRSNEVLRDESKTHYGYVLSLCDCRQLKVIFSYLPSSSCRHIHFLSTEMKTPECQTLAIFGTGDTFFKNKKNRKNLAKSDEMDPMCSK